MNTKIQVEAGRNSFSSLAILFGLALLSCSVSAAPPNPPVFTALDDQELDHPNPDSRYSLEDAIRGLPFTVNTPRPPQVEAEQVVTPSTLGNYINTPGMRLILEPGNYGNRTFNSQDQEIILREGVYFGSVSIGGSARRISIRNEVPRSGNMATISMPEGGWAGFPEDILIDGIRSDAGGNRNFVHGNRIAFLNSFIRTVDFPLSAFNGSFNDVIIANCNLENYGASVSGHAEQAGVRFHNVNRFVFVDSRVSKTSGGKHVFRLHGGVGADIFHAYVGRNQMGTRMHAQFIPSGGGAPTSDRFHDIWFEDNDLHIDGLTPSGGNFLSVWHEEAHLQRFYVRRNNFYGNDINASVGGSIFMAPVAHTVPWIGPEWVVEDNTISSYQVPPAWGFR